MRVRQQHCGGPTGSHSDCSAKRFAAVTPSTWPLTLLRQVIWQLLSDTPHGVEVVLLHVCQAWHRRTDAVLTRARVVQVDCVRYLLPQPLEPLAGGLNLKGTRASQLLSSVRNWATTPASPWVTAAATSSKTLRTTLQHAASKQAGPQALRTQQYDFALHMA